MKTEQNQNNSATPINPASCIQHPESGSPPLQHSSTPPLALFSNVCILEQIGHRRVAKFLSAFATELSAASLTLPSPEPETPEYFPAVAAVLAQTERLPEPLLTTMLALET